MRTLLALLMLTVAAAAATAPSVSLSWTASPTAGVTYTVLRGASCTGTFTAITTGLAVTTYSDTTVAPGGAYAYEVEAVSAAGAASSPTNCVTANIPPLPPSNLVEQILLTVLRFFKQLIRWA